MSKESDVLATCQIDFTALQHEFDLATSVRYAELYQAERYADEFPTAFLICDEHNSMIRTLHPEEI